MSGISKQTWMIEKHIAQQSLDLTGRLPTGNQLGGRFWDMVDSHYENAVATGHLARFDYYHSPFVIAVETSAHTIVLPAPPPASHYVPPEQHVTVHQPVPTTPVPPPHYGHPGPSGGHAVPEPSSVLLALPMFVIMLVRMMQR